MTNYTCTITAVLDVDRFEDVVDEFTAWVSMPGCVEDGLIIVPTHDHDNPDTVWHGLTLAAKRTWIAAMMPDPRLGPVEFIPDEPALRTPDEATIALIVGNYIDTVRRNTSTSWPAITNVLAAIEHDGHNGTGSRWEITMEMWEAAPDGTIPADLTDAECDMWNDRLWDALDTVKTALERTTP